MIADRTIVLIWENFGPIHLDRCNALSEGLKGRSNVTGIELGEKSHTYPWTANNNSLSFEKITLFDCNIDMVPFAKKFTKLLIYCMKFRRTDFFFCHYEEPFIFFTAILLRLCGRRVFIMNDSKYDDHERYWYKEVLKVLLYLPYNGGLASGIRSKDYLRFLGLPRAKIASNYNVLSVERLQKQADSDQADRIEYLQRDFVIIARFVTKKNIDMCLRAYKIYAEAFPNPRRLNVCGSGPLEKELKTLSCELNIENNVIFHGFLQTTEVCIILHRALALILPSIEEQFGNVVIEAIALGIPVIISENCGARDNLVRNGVNGFVIEPDNEKGLSYFMGLLANDENLWDTMSEATKDFKPSCDVQNFVDAVESLLYTVNV